MAAAPSLPLRPKRRWPQFLEWPLPPSVVNRYAPTAAAALLAPVAVIIWRYNLRRPTAAEVEWQEEELARKREKLESVIHQARGFLAALEQERRKYQEEHEGAGGAPAEDDEAEAMSGVDRFLIKLVGGKRKDEEFKIRFVDMWQTCREVQALCKDHELLAPGMDLAAQILSMELTRASLRTLGGKDPQFSNGEKLKERLHLAKYFRQTAARLRPDFSPEQRAAIDLHCTQLWRKYVAGYAILGKQNKWDVFYAMQMVLTAKREVLVLFVASLMSAMKGVFDALDVLYMSDSVEMLRNTNFKWGDFRAQLRAFISLRLLNSGLQLLIDRVSSLGRQQMEHRLRTDLYRSLLHQDFEWYRLGQADERDMKSIFGSVFRLPANVTALTSTFTAMIEKGTSAFSQLAILLTKSSGLFKAMVLLEFSGILARKGIVYCIDYAKWDLDRRQVTVDVQWHEPLAPENLPTTRAFTAEERTLTNWEMFWGSTMRKDSLKQVIDALGAPFLVMADNITQIGSTIRAAQLIKRNEVNMSDFQAIQMMSRNIVWHTRSLIGTWAAAKENYEPLARSWEIISVEPTIGLRGGLEPPNRAVGALTFEEVEFKYEEGPVVIKGVTFQADAGTKCAITGTSGSGKTTVFKLLERFYDPQKGKILLDGQDIRDLNPVWLRRQISIVDQRPRILSLPLRDNLIYGCKDDPSLQQIEDACRVAGIYDFVFRNKDKFPAGLYTRISPYTLSGGELQRVAIARAVLKDAPILLLDEATSALDSHTQTAVKGAISKLMEGRTTVMIAHRLETIKEADQIMVMSEGEVVERGTHAELVSQAGHYAELYEQQVTETMVGGMSPPALRG